MGGLSCRSVSSSLAYIEIYVDARISIPGWFV